MSYDEICPRAIEVFWRGQIYGRLSWHMCATIIKLFVDCSQHMEYMFALKGSSRAVLPRGVSVCWAWTFGLSRMCVLVGQYGDGDAN